MKNVSPKWHFLYFYVPFMAYNGVNRQATAEGELTQCWGRYQHPVDMKKQQHATNLNYLLCPSA